MKTATFLAAAAAAANAFIIIPETSSSDDTVLSILPVHGLPASNEPIVATIPCPSCPRAVDAATLKPLSDETPRLQLTFTVDHSSRPGRLLVNNFEIFPLTDDPIADPLTAVALEGDDWARDVPLGYKIEVYPIAKDDENKVIGILGVELQIIEVDGFFINDIPIVKVQLVQQGGDLAIAKMEAVEPKPVNDGQDCHGMFCSIKDMFGKMFKPKKPCTGTSRHGGKMHRPSVEEIGHGHHGYHGPHGPHGHHGGEEESHMGMMDHGHGRPGQKGFDQSPHMRHGFFASILGVIVHVLLPVVVGICAGIAMSLYVTSLLVLVPL